VAPRRTLSERERLALQQGWDARLKQQRELEKVNASFARLVCVLRERQVPVRAIGAVLGVGPSTVHAWELRGYAQPWPSGSREGKGGSRRPRPQDENPAGDTE
jgi:hypothetical protein